MSNDDKQIIGLLLVGVVLGFLACLLILYLSNRDGYRIDKDDKVTIKGGHYRVIDIKYNVNDQRNITLEVNRL